MAGIQPETPKGFSRKEFLRLGSLVGAAATAVVLAPRVFSSITVSLVDNQQVPKTLPVLGQAFTSEEVPPKSETKIYNDLTPGIGVAVGWVGHASSWNTIVENLIKAITGAGIDPYIFVPKHLRQDCTDYLNRSGLGNNQYNLIVCEPDYALEDNARNIDGANVAEVKRKGFLSSWIRDWAPLIIDKGLKKTNINIRKGNMPNPLMGTGIDLETEDPGLDFDGGAFFYIDRSDGIPVCLVAEKELVNNNTWQFPSDKDPKNEATQRLKALFGEVDVIMLPSLNGDSVDHVDISCMPVGEDRIVVGQALETDSNYSILNRIEQTLSAVNFKTSRVPVRREGNNLISWTNVLPLIRKDGKKLLFMPTYDGYDNENDEAEATYRSLGFEVIRVDATSVKNRGGAIHCATTTSVTAALMKDL